MPGPGPVPCRPGTCDGRFQSGAFDQAGHSIEAAISILGGAAAAFAYTGDLATEIYKYVVEPTMAERTGFSGLWSSDHAEFRRQHKLLQQSLAEMPPKFPVLVQRYAYAINAAWMSHSAVCKHAAGMRTSINAESAANAEKHLPGHMELKHFTDRKA